MTRAAPGLVAGVMAVATLSLVLIAPVLPAGAQQPATVSRIGVLGYGPEPMAGMRAFRATLPPKYELVVNLRAAKALGLVLPPLVVQRADRLIY